MLSEWYGCLWSGLDSHSVFMCVCVNVRAYLKTTANKRLSNGAKESTTIVRLKEIENK